MSLQDREKFSDIVIQATNQAVFVPNPCKNAESATIEGAFCGRLEAHYLSSHAGCAGSSATSASSSDRPRAAATPAP